jgi:hypothetical protein
VRDECLAQVLRLPAEQRFVTVSPPNPCPTPQAILTARSFEGDPVGPDGMGDRQYSYTKNSGYHVIPAFFFVADDTGDPYPNVAGGTYKSLLNARITVYENGTTVEFQEEYDASVLHGIGVGIKVAVARTVDIGLTDRTLLGPYLFNVIAAGMKGSSEKKEIWISGDRQAALYEAVMRVVVSAENGFPVPGGAGLGWRYPLDLQK